VLNIYTYNTFTIPDNNDLFPFRFGYEWRVIPKLFYSLQLRASSRYTVGRIKTSRNCICVHIWKLYRVRICVHGAGQHYGHVRFTRRDDATRRLANVCVSSLIRILSHQTVHGRSRTPGPLFVLSSVADFYSF